MMGAHVDSSSEMNLRARLKSFILAHCLPGETAENLSDDFLLRKNGILDSISLLKLVRFIETEFDMEIEPRDIAGNFDSIAALVAFVSRRQGNAVKSDAAKGGSSG